LNKRKNKGRKKGHRKEGRKEGGGGWDRERAATESTMMRLGTFFRRERLASLERGRKDQRRRWW
jgi:hypothetical protein